MLDLSSHKVYYWFVVTLCADPIVYCSMFFIARFVYVELRVLIACWKIRNQVSGGPDRMSQNWPFCVSNDLFDSLFCAVIFPAKRRKTDDFFPHLENRRLKGISLTVDLPLTNEADFLLCKRISVTWKLFFQNFSPPFWSCWTHKYLCRISPQIPKLTCQLGCLSPPKDDQSFKKEKKRRLDKSSFYPPNEASSSRRVLLSCPSTSDMIDS